MVTLLDADQRQYEICLTGIDAPEKKMRFGQRPREHPSDLLFRKDGQVETGKLDRYGHTLGKILLDRNGIKLAMDALIAQTREHGASLVLVTHSEAATGRADQVVHLSSEGISA